MLSTSLQGIADKARKESKHRFRNLYGMLNEDFLAESWRWVRKNAASGVDGVSAREYERDLATNIRSLVERLKEKRYRAKLVRRHWIPKENGKERPLGIPVVEDKLLQVAVARILSAIYEQDFLRCSYGYRPRVGAHDAIDKLTVKLQFGRYHHVVEIDLENYFGTIDHDWLGRMLKERIDDEPFLRLIRKWLKAGVLETDGQVVHPATGTPQGGVVSPVLANVYLHYVLDLWFHRKVVRACRGEACLIRYADDVVCAFEHAEEAGRFLIELEVRLSKFGLKLSPTKTRRLGFDREGDGREAFDFLGFEFRWGRDRQGRPHLKRRTARKSLRRSLARFTLWCREHRHTPVRRLLAEVSQKLRGYYRYFGIYGNSRSLWQFHFAAMRILQKWLNRRSDRRSYNWAGFRELLEHLQVPRPVIAPSAGASSS
ncbi:MAG: group II intron reverse transcriptase/maturase [Candidatus Eisenbacteria bacterium]